MESTQKKPGISEIEYQAYFKALTTGNKRECFRILDETLSRDVPMEDVYLKLFQRSLYHIGELWEVGKLSIATEHIATAITNYLIGHSFTRLQPKCPNGFSVVISCMPEEHHSLGARIIADLIEIQGFDVFFLGANTPEESVFEAVEKHKPVATAFSVSLSQNIQALESILLKLAKFHPKLNILLGGQAFRWMEAPFKDVRQVQLINSIPLLYQTLNTIEKNEGL